MGASKNEHFSKEQNEISQILKAMAHPARIAILQYLLNEKTCICRDIVEELPLAQATVSQHLKELKNAHIIQGTITGKSVCYCINPHVFHQISEFIFLLMNKNTEKENCC